MDANTVIAICGVVIAVASLGLSAHVARATRRHNRFSVRPLLGLTALYAKRQTATALGLLIRRVFRARPPPAHMPADLAEDCSSIRTRRQR